MKSSIIGIIGNGELATATTKALENHYSALVLGTDWEEKNWGNADLLLVLTDNWNPSLHRKIQALAPHIPWLRCFLAFGEAIIGPLIAQDTPCFHCADRRLLMGGQDRKEMWSIYHQFSSNPSLYPAQIASSFGLRHIQHILLEEIKNIINNQSMLKENTIITNLTTLQTTRHPILADPLCNVCNTLSDDQAENNVIKLQANPKSTKSSFRVRPFPAWKDPLKHTYYDERTGIVKGKIHDYRSPFAAASVHLPLYVGQESTAGRTHRFGDSEITAIFEGLERSCGIAPRRTRTIVHDSYHQLQANALHPESVGTHSKEQYALPHFPFQAFDPDQKMHWVWGYSFNQEKSILVPELLAYYSLGGGKGFVYETSNGCALGGNLEEAILHGILEIMERDAFLMTWYAKLELPRIDPYSSGDKELDLMLHRIEAIAGYEIHLFDATMEHGIPTIWAIAKNKKASGFHLICAAGTHFEPIKAAKNAIHELAGMMLTLDKKAEKQRAKYVNMVDKPHLVQEMPDHSMLYSIPETEHRLHFLLHQKKNNKTFQQIKRPPIAENDLTDDLRYLLQTLKNLQLDVIVVNQTTTELQQHQLHCVKVIIPGMLPMTFGHHLTRLTGLSRVLHVPQILGYTNTTLTLDQLNPHPHPFP
ncbi:TOMM precursor leader peptide-binding protein [Shimazuella kribbensis]|uniref:TOMM precursor leader peptide-binding protein n=1 Tax=Shimazuella kribbensis TaxID=139808 RepID=UPI00041B2E0F|nr:TOMM precursor leader peptide-binding protein [Shimazuella kribbensis]